ncbi:MAG TPA: TetR/AcrR family transcriptional regulator [Actinotalea sp.]
MSDPRRQAIIDGAFEVFMRYGYRRATMDDIAQRVGLSRPTLYLTFPNKEAILRAVVEAGHERILGEIEAGLPALRSLTDQLLHVFEIWSVQPFEMVVSSPAADELMNDSFGFVGDVFDRSSQRLADLLTGLFRDAVVEPDALDPSAPARAQVLIAAALGFKSKARDTAHMRQLIRDLVAMTVAGLPSALLYPQHPNRRRTGANRG